MAEIRDDDHPGAWRRYPGTDLPARTAERLPILVYAHGGGFVFCDLDSHDGLCRDIANRIPAVVVSVAYRLGAGAPVARGGRGRLRRHPVGSGQRGEPRGRRATASWWVATAREGIWPPSPR